MVTIKRILCPVDFSDTSSRALDYAAAAARWYGARVDVLHVHAEVPAVSVIPSLAPAPAAQFADREEEHAQVQELTSRLARGVLDKGVQGNVSIVDGPDAHRAILAYAARHHSDLIVMGTHGRTGIERWLLGSTTDRVVRKAACPTMVVPPHADEAVPPGAVNFDSILCAIDFSEGSLVALEYALSIAEEADAHLTVLNVIEVPPELEPRNFGTQVDVDRIRAEAEAERLRRLRALVPDEAREYCHLHTAVTEGSAYREILRTADQRRSDLIVMGVQGRGAVDRLMFGSNTSQVVRAANCPVLIVPRG